MTQTELEHLTVKSTLYTLTPEVQILVRFALGLAVSEILHILSFPIDSHVDVIWSHVNENEKKNAKNPLKFRKYLYRTLVETLPRSMHDLFGSESIMYFQRCCLNFILLYGPTLTKRKKKSFKKIKKKNFEKQN